MHVEMNDNLAQETMSALRHDGVVFCLHLWTWLIKNVLHTVFDSCSDIQKLGRWEFFDEILPPIYCTCLKHKLKFYILPCIILLLFFFRCSHTWFITSCTTYDKWRCKRASQRSTRSEAFAGRSLGQCYSHWSQLWQGRDLTTAYYSRGIKAALKLNIFG